MTSKHQQSIDNLIDRLSKKPYVKSAIRNFEYTLGECDVLAIQGDYDRNMYYEVKSNDTIKCYKKAVHQLKRWSKYWYNKVVYRNRDCVGVYYVEGKQTKPKVKNGILRR